MSRCRSLVVVSPSPKHCDFSKTVQPRKIANTLNQLLSETHRHHAHQFQSMGRSQGGSLGASAYGGGTNASTLGLSPSAAKTATGGKLIAAVERAQYGKLLLENRDVPQESGVGGMEGQIIPAGGVASARLETGVAQPTTVVNWKRAQVAAAGRSGKSNKRAQLRADAFARFTQRSDGKARYYESRVGVADGRPPLLLE